MLINLNTFDFLTLKNYFQFLSLSKSFSLSSMFNGCQIFKHIISGTQANPTKLGLRLVVVVVFASLLTRIIKVKKLNRGIKLKKKKALLDLNLNLQIYNMGTNMECFGFYNVISKKKIIKEC